MGEGSVIGSAASPNVRSGRMRRGAILGAAAIPLFLIALWVRTPALPRTAGNPAAGAGDRLSAAEGAVRALQRALIETRDRLMERANGALDAPTDAKGAFDYLANRWPQKEIESVILIDRGHALAWSGETRTNVDSLTAP